MLKRILTKDARNLCDIKEIIEGGYVLLDGDLVEIYKIEPINMVSYDAETKKKTV